MTENPIFTPPYPLKTAVLFLVFNRLDTTTQVFEAIRNAKPPRLYVAADGPRFSKEGEPEKVQAVRDYVLEHIDWDCEVKTLFRDENLGCKYAVSSAITWFFENEEMGIILEDDVLPLPSFFYYCDELLERYKDNESIALISGCNMISRYYEPASSYFFSKYNFIWGWASWRRSWREYDVRMAQWPAWKALGVLRDLSDGNRFFSMYWGAFFDKVHAGHIDTWDFQWTFACWRKGAVSVLPKYNLVSNLGFSRADATHTTGEIPGVFIHSVQKNIDFPMCHPESIVRSCDADRLVDKLGYSISFGSALKRVMQDMPCVRNLLKKIKQISFSNSH